MLNTYSVPLTTVVKDFGLRVAYASTDYEAIRLTVEDIARPGLQLAGYLTTLTPCGCRCWAMWKPATWRSSPPRTVP